MIDIKNIMDKVKQTVDANEQHKDGLSKRKALFACGLVGLIAGIMVGYSRKWNLMYSAIGGAAIGAIAGGLLSPKD